MSDQVNKAHQATPAATLEQQIMDPNFPKNEREWWAADRIAQLEAALRHYSCTCANEFDGCKARYDMTVCCGWTARAALGEDRT